MTHPVETVAFIHGDRHVPAKSVPRRAQALHDAGIDMVGFAHQLGNFIPDQLWTAQNAPLATRMGDPDSFNDAFLSAAHTAGSISDVGLTVNTDAIRTGPAQLIQMMMTLAHMTQGRTLFNIGGGEIKSLNPYGYKRSQGLKRLEDLLNVFTRFWESDEPISYQGHYWNLDKAFLGGAKPYKPRIHTMGGGPKIMDLATSFCDGFTTALPCAWPTPEHAADSIAQLKRDVADKGRDPDKFDIFVQAIVLLHEDEDVIARAMENPIIRWIAAMWGRIQPNCTWEESGLVSPVPADWSYHLHFRPHDTDDSWLEEVVGKTTPDHVAAGYLCGTPAQVADQLQSYVEAGATIVAPLDFLSLVLDPDDGGSIRRVIECTNRLKTLAAV
jgi:phthiodiolone/phenolphthiodiolone dimycocerosates ketoreductase